MPPQRQPLSEFARDRLGIELWPKLEEIFAAVERGDRKILVRSCNGAGKTTAAAAICNWKLSQFPNSIVLTTASSWTQVRRTLWGEIRKQARRAELYIDEKGKLLPIKSTAIELGDKHYMLGISPSIPENAQGFHSDSMLIVVDEATGVSPEIFDALSGNMTGTDAQLLVIYNPLTIECYPYTAELSGDWTKIQISAFDHPNVIGGGAIKGAVSRTWIEDRLKSWSFLCAEDDPSALILPWNGEAWYRTAPVDSRILGQWPGALNDGLIMMSHVEQSTKLQLPPGPVRSMGVDVASRGNDETVFAFFDGPVQLPFYRYRGRDLMFTVSEILRFYNEGFTVLAVDDSGLGSGVTDRLTELLIPVLPIHFGSKARGVVKDCANARAEMYLHLNNLVKDSQVQLVDDRFLHQELTSVRVRSRGEDNRYLLEEKRHVAQRIGRSPDRADATCLALYAQAIHNPELFIP